MSGARAGHRSAPGDLVHLIAPTGRLRAVINLGNPVLAQGSASCPRGVTVAIARALARWLDVAVQLSCVDAARDAYTAMVQGRSDLCFLADEPARAEAVTFTAPYVRIEGVFVVEHDSPMLRLDQVDRTGIRIGVRRGSAYDLFLTRTIERAEVVRADEAVDVYEQEHLDVLAGVRQPMTEHVAATGRRLIEPAFMQINQAVGLPRDRDPRAAAAVADFVDGLRRSGFVQAELDRSGVTATAAPG